MQLSQSRKHSRGNKRWGLMTFFCCVERIVKPSVKPFNITILEGFIIHNATVAADAFIIQDIDATTCLLC